MSFWLQNQPEHLLHLSSWNKPKRGDFQNKSLSWWVHWTDLRNVISTQDLMTDTCTLTVTCTSGPSWQFWFMMEGFCKNRTLLWFWSWCCWSTHQQLLCPDTGTTPKMLHSERVIWEMEVQITTAGSARYLQKHNIPEEQRTDGDWIQSWGPRGARSRSGFPSGSPSVCGSPESDRKEPQNQNHNGNTDATCSSSRMQLRWRWLLSMQG